MFHCTVICTIIGEMNWIEWFTCWPQSTLINLWSIGQYCYSGMGETSVQDAAKIPEGQVQAWIRAEREDHLEHVVGETGTERSTSCRSCRQETTGPGDHHQHRHWGCGVDNRRTNCVDIIRRDLKDMDGHYLSPFRNLCRQPSQPPVGYRGCAVDSRWRQRSQQPWRQCRQRRRRGRDPWRHNYVTFAGNITAAVPGYSQHLPGCCGQRVSRFCWLEAKLSLVHCTAERSKSFYRDWSYVHQLRK